MTKSDEFFHNHAGFTLSSMKILLRAEGYTFPFGSGEEVVLSMLKEAVKDGYAMGVADANVRHREAYDSATLTTIQTIANDIGLSKEGTAKEVEDRILAEFHRLRNIEATYRPPSEVGDILRLSDTRKESLMAIASVLDVPYEGTSTSVRESILKKIKVLKMDADFCLHNKIKSLALELGVRVDPESKEYPTYDAIVKAFKEAKAAGAKEERDRIEKIVEMAAKSYEDLAAQQDMKSAALRRELEESERMAEEQHRDADAHKAVLSAIYIDEVAIATVFGVDGKDD